MLASMEELAKRLCVAGWWHFFPRDYEAFAEFDYVEEYSTKYIVGRSRLHTIRFEIRYLSLSL